MTLPEVHRNAPSSMPEHQHAPCGKASTQCSQGAVHQILEAQPTETEDWIATIKASDSLSYKHEL